MQTLLLHAVLGLAFQQSAHSFQHQSLSRLTTLKSPFANKASFNLDDINTYRDDGGDVSDEYEIDVDHIKTFRDFDYKIPTWLLHKCDSLGFIEPTLTQKVALPLIFNGTDVVLQAQTGSGKTLSYCLPILSKIDPFRSSIQAVIVIPSRELGLQVTGVLRRLVSDYTQKKIQIMPLLEGSQNRRQQLWATAEPPHILVGTPNSIQKLVEMGRLKLNAVSFVVLDEVDASLSNYNSRKELHELLSRKLSNSYQNSNIEEENDSGSNSVFKNLVKNQRGVSTTTNSFRNSRQTIICSATIPQRKYFIDNCLQNGWTETLPTLIHVSREALVPKQVNHEYIVCDSDKSDFTFRISCLKYLVKTEIDKFNENDIASNYIQTDIDGFKENESFQAMIFIDEKEIVDKIKSSMLALFPSSDYNIVSYIDESMNLDERAEILSSFREGKCKILLCTNIVARGIDVLNTSHIFQVSLPKSIEDYIHRSGRTGRHNRRGKVLTLINDDEKFVINRFSNEIGVIIKERVLKVKKKL